MFFRTFFFERTLYKCHTSKPDIFALNDALIPPDFNRQFKKTLFTMTVWPPFICVIYFVDKNFQLSRRPSTDAI